MKKRGARSRRTIRKEDGKAALTPGLFIPDSTLTTLRWGFSGSASASGTYGETVFSGNGLFDPGVASASTQPIGFDQYAIWYNRYHVGKSKISLEFQLQSTSATPVATALGARVVLYPSNTAAVASSYTEACAQPRAVFAEIGTIPIRLTKSLKSSQVLGFNGSYVDSTDSAAVTAQPTAQWYWHIGIISGSYTSVESTLTAHIDYGSRFFYRVTQPLSLLEKLQRELGLALREEMKRREAVPYVPSFKPDDKEETQETKVFTRSGTKSSTLQSVIGDIEDVPLRSDLFKSQCGVNPLAASFDKKGDPLPAQSGNVDALLEKARKAQREYSLAHAQSQLGAKSGVTPADGTNPTSRRWVMVEPAKESDPLGNSLILNPAIKPPTIPMNGKASI